ncbi:MAG: cell division protein FtsQ/DivIB [Acidimicrobiales bacterium]
MTATRTRSTRRVDPRLQARRQTVARRDGLRRLRFVAALTATATLAIVAVAVAHSSWLDIERVDVIGAERASPQQIVTASGILIGEPLVDVDSDEVATAVARVPWVAEASVDRVWTGSVRISIVERVGVVALPAGSRYAVVDRTGQQLEVVSDQPEGFVPVVGVEASGVPGQQIDDDILHLVHLVEAMTPGVAAVTDRLTIEDGRLIVELSVGGRADLGDDRDLAAKLAALETVLARVDLACLDTIDVRVPEAPTVRRTVSGTEDEEPLGDATGC